MQLNRADKANPLGVEGSEGQGASVAGAGVAGEGATERVRVEAALGRGGRLGRWLERRLPEFPSPGVWDALAHWH
jgi:hypothetical protein